MIILVFSRQAVQSSIDRLFRPILRRVIGRLPEFINRFTLGGGWRRPSDQGGCLGISTVSVGAIIPSM